MMPAPAQATDAQPSAQATFCATLVDEWVRRGLAHAVIAPGSRSTPMALALAAREELRIHVLHDERSAAFVALGIGSVAGVPAALLCTSGTAATHFHAAVVEASLSNVPLLVLTADRPPELHGVGAPQTIDQTHLYGRAPRWFQDPGVPDDAARGSWRGLAARAFVACTGAEPGPVHLNLPFREPLLGAAGPLPPALSVLGAAASPPAGGAADCGELLQLIDGKRGVIVAGRGVDDPAAVSAAAAAMGWPVLADPRSGCRPVQQAVLAFDAIVRHPGFAAANRPEVVLRFGEPPSSKALVEWLAGGDAVEVQVDASARVIDPGHRIALRVQASASQVCRQLVEHVVAGDSSGWLETWLAADQRAQVAIDQVLGAEPHMSEPATARVLTGESMDGCRLVLGSSMPVRDAEWYGRRCPGLAVHSNRGANGIDGVVGTAVGVAIASRQPTVVLLGDVSFCHDASSLTALAARGLDLTIVVLDNDGGGIFSFLPQAEQLAAERFEQLYGTPHGTDIVALAAAHGIAAHDVAAPDDLLQAVTVTGTSVVRIAGDRPANTDLHRRLNAAVAAALDPG